MSENIDPKAKQEFLTMIGHSLEVLEGGLISDVNRQSIRNGILEAISNLMDQRDAANARAEKAEARAERLQAVLQGLMQFHPEDELGPQTEEYWTPEYKAAMDAARDALKGGE